MLGFLIGALPHFYWRGGDYRRRYGILLFILFESYPLFMQPHRAGIARVAVPALAIGMDPTKKLRMSRGPKALTF